MGLLNHLFFCHRCRGYFCCTVVVAIAAVLPLSCNNISTDVFALQAQLPLYRCSMLVVVPCGLPPTGYQCREGLLSSLSEGNKLMTFLAVGGEIRAFLGEDRDGVVGEA